MCQFCSEGRGGEPKGVWASWETALGHILPCTACVVCPLGCPGHVCRHMNASCSHANVGRAKCGHSAFIACVVCPQMSWSHVQDDCGMLFSRSSSHVLYVPNLCLSGHGSVCNACFRTPPFYIPCQCGPCQRGHLVLAACALRPLVLSVPANVCRGSCEPGSCPVLHGFRLSARIHDCHVHRWCCARCSVAQDGGS